MPERGQRVWNWIFRVTRYHAFVILGVTALLAGLSLYYTRNVPLRSTFFDLLPQNDPLIAAYEENEAYLAQTDTVVLLLTLRSPEDKPEEERKRALLLAAEEIASLVRRDPEIREVTYLLSPSPEIPDQYLLLYRLDPGRLARIESSVALAGSALAGRKIDLPPGSDLASAYREATARVSGALEAGFSEISLADGSGTSLSSLIALNTAVLQALSALDTLPEITTAVRDLADIFAPAEQVPREPEAFFSRDKTRLLISALPRLPPQTGVDYCKKVLKSVEDAISSVGLDRLDVSVGITGSYAFTAETNDVINTDMQKTEVITSIGVFLVFLISFGSFLYSLIAAIPLSVALLLTTVWTKAALGGFNLITTFVPALILGLGDDFAIHLISRYVEERKAGAPFNRALFTALWRKGTAILVGSLAIVLVFLGLLTARSRALFELGAISSVGVFLAFLAAIVLIPSLLTAHHLLFHRKRERERFPDYAPRFAGFFRFTTRRSRGIVAAVIALTAVAALLATKTHFQFSSTDLTPQVKSQKTLNEIVTAFDLGGTTQLGTYFLFFAKTEVDLVATAERLKENPLVLKVDSAQRLLPPNLADQQKTLKSLDIAAYADDLDFFDRSLAARQNVLTEIRTLEIQSSLIEYAATLNGEIGLGRDVRTLEGQLRKIQEALRTIPVDEARRSVLELEEALRSLDLRLAEVRELPPVETLLRDILRSYPTEISSQFLTPDGRYIIRAQMSPALFQGSNLKDFDRFAASFSDDYFGMPLVIRDLERAMKQDFFLSTLLAVVFIAFIVWRTFRGLRRTLLALSPLVLSYAWMLGGMRLLGIDFNFINITISPLLVGLGVESGVMLLARYDEERGLAPAGAIERAGQTTIVAILTSLFTTMLVFATLLLARTPGLRYLGICAVMGLGFSLFASLVFLPAALSLRRKGPGA